MRTLSAAAFALLFVTLLISACGKPSGRAPLPQKSGALRTTAQLQGGGGAGYLHVPATWQDTRGFTPYVDYRPDQILVLFSDELSQGAQEAPPGLGQPSYNPSSVIIKSAAHAQFARSLASAYGMSVIPNSEAYIPGLYFCTYRLPPDTDTEALMQRILDENPADVRLAEYNPIYHLLYTPNDPKVQDGTQWFHKANRMDDYGAWDLAQGDPGVWVAIIDTGVDMDHPDLAANIVPINTLFPGEIFDLGQNDTWPDDNGSHGSHCAGIACAVGDNATGGAGVAYECSILPIKLTNGSGQFAGSSITAIALADACGASVISMSFGSFLPSETLKQACDAAWNDGLIICAAAGNDSSTSQTFYPAGIPVVIAVGATDENDNRAGFSDYGAFVDIAAPGTNIYSTVIGGYDNYQGTSMACPMVAGAAALVKSYYPAATNDQVRGLLESTGTPLPAGQWANDYMHRVDTAAALNASPSEPPVVTIDSPAYNDPVTGQFQIDCSVAHPGGGTTQRALLYLDGWLMDELYSPGDSFSFDCDVTDRYPVGMNVVVEVIDTNYVHAYAFSNFVVTDSFEFSGPYFEDFNKGAAEHWTANSFAGAASWRIYEESAGPPVDYSLRLGNPYYYNSDDSDWLWSPLFNLRGTRDARLIFHAQYNVSSSKPMYMAIWSQTSSGFIGAFTNTGDDYYGLSLKNYCYQGPTTPGQVIQFFFMQEGSNAGGQGTFALDDFYVLRPTALPEVSIDFPTEGLTVGGIVPINVTVTDDCMWEVDPCEIYSNGVLIATTHDPSWGTMLDTTTLPSGPIEISATVYEDDGFDRDGPGGPSDQSDDYSADTDTVETVTATRSFFIAHQTVTSVSPTSGFYYDEVTLTGSHFGDYNPGVTTVDFTSASGMIPSQIASWTDTEIICIVPIGAVTGRLRVDIGGATRETSQVFTVFTPFDDFAYAYENAPPDLMFDGDFFIRIAPQPDMDSITTRIAGYAGKEWSIATRDNPSDQMMLIDVSGLSTGVYTLELEGFVGPYSEKISGVFFLNTLPGDFNGNGVVDDPDVAYLYDYLALHGGSVIEGDPGFYPFLDVTGDGIIDEADAAFVGYHWGATLGG